MLGALQIASYDPDPDYFFHWLRDSSLVMDALRILILDGTIGRKGLALLADFLRFSLSLSSLNGAAVLKRGDPRRGVDADFLRYLRPDTELKEVEGDRVLGDVRFNVDGTLDTILWCAHSTTVRLSGRSPPFATSLWPRRWRTTPGPLCASSCAAISTLLSAIGASPV